MLAICAGTISYFTARAEKGGTLAFAELEVQLLNSSGQTFDDDVFQSTYVKDLLPGSTIDIDNIKVKNTGDVSVYTLLNLQVKITKAGVPTLKYDAWYNCAGTKVDTTNFAANTAEADLLNVNAELPASVQFTLPGEDITNEYKQATVSVELSAEALQTQLPDAQIYVSKPAYAAYKIYTNKLTEKSKLGKNLFNFDAWADAYSAADSDSHWSVDTANQELNFYAEVEETSGINDAGIISYYSIPLKTNTDYILSWEQDNDTEKPDIVIADAAENPTSYMALNGTPVKKNGRYYFPFNSGNNQTVCFGFMETVTPQQGETISYTMSKFQLEEGIEATDYIPFQSGDPEPLRKLNGVSDTIDTENRTITRRTGKAVLDYDFVMTNIAGDIEQPAEGWVALTLNLPNKYIGAEADTGTDTFWYCDRLENVELTDEGFVFKNCIVWAGGETDGAAIAILLEASTKEELLEYTMGDNPFVVYYLLETPVVENY